MADKTCRHCGKPAARPRGLCWRCSADPEIREQYPSRSKYGNKGVGHLGGHPADRPCPHPPGTEEKLAELERRALMGVALWHSGDARGNLS